MKDLENPMTREIIAEEEKNVQREKFKIEIGEYKELLAILGAVEELKIETTSPKVSLAFMIEEMKNNNPEGWREDLKRFKDGIEQVAHKDGKFGVTWMVCEAISSTYIAFLERRKQEVQDDSMQRKLEIIKQMAEDSFQFNLRIRERGGSVAFGGVSLDYVPQWYYL